MKQSLSAKIKNLLRGGASFWSIRRRILTELLSAPTEELEVDSSFLISSLLRLNATSNWTALKFSKTDWHLLARLQRVERNSMVERNLLYLTALYVATNAQRCLELATLDGEAATLVLASEADKIEELIRKTDKVNRQSLFSFRLFAAANATSHSYVAKYFGEEIHAGWVRQRFVYPLIYFTINRPSPEQLDGTLLSIFPWLETEPSERQVVRYLLRHDFDHSDSLSFKCYVALLAHPYDALEMVTHHFEDALTSRRRLTRAENEVLTGLAAINLDRRVSVLGSVTRNEPVSVRGGSAIDFDFQLSEPDRQLFSAFFDLDRHDPVEGRSRLMGALSRLRWNRYPSRADFEAVVGLCGQYSFMSLGRILDIALTSIYMVSRRTEAAEYKTILRCLYYFESFTPFLLTGPRGASALRTNFLSWSPSVSECEQLVSASNAYDGDRTWIKFFHWGVREVKRRLRLPEYLAKLRGSIHPSPNSRYLSGVDWSWVEEVISALRISPFRSPDGVYVLLLRAIEERDRQPNYVRMALRPEALAANSVGNFVARLMDEYGKDSLAFIRVFLSAEMILKMGLEGYYAAALAERLDAMTKAVERFGFDDEMLTEEQFLSEQRTLSSALMLMNVHSAQFAVSWETIKDAATLSASETFAAFDAVNRTFNELPLLSDGMRTSALTFANRQTVVYTLKNRHWPAAVIVGQVIDAFLSHPSHGIESILAVRIRHDNLRYEFGLAIDAMRGSRIVGVSETDLRDLLPRFETAIAGVINVWVDRYMHTSPGPDREALFDFIPTPNELLEFVDRGNEETPLSQLIEQVVAWQQERLSRHLASARRLLDEDLRPKIATTIESVSEILQAENAIAYRAGRIDKVGKTLRSVMDTRCDALREWFDSPPLAQTQELSFLDIKLAVDGRFRSEIESEKLLMRISENIPADLRVAADSVRLVFDIWSELARNAMKYSGCSTARMRVWRTARDGRSVFVFSSLRAKSQDVGTDQFLGEPSVSTSSSIFRSGRSGLPKVAHLAASVAAATVTVHVDKKRGAFHVVVPLEPVPPS